MDCSFVDSLPLQSGIFALCQTPFCLGLREVFILRKCPPFRGTKKRTEEWRGCLGSCPPKNMTAEEDRDQLRTSALGNCLPYRDTRKMTKERKGPTLGSILGR